MFRHIATVLITGVLMAAFLPSPCRADNWHDRLYLSGGDYWRARLPITVTNRQETPVGGQLIDIPVTDTGPTAVLIGTPVRAIRVCDQAGVEMRYSVENADGQPVREGTIQLGSHLIIPVSCAAGQTARTYVYFDNPRAQRVPDYLLGRARLVNGDVEYGEGSAPIGWEHDSADASHQAVWADDAAQSGKRSLKMIVAEGAEPTWIATRQGDIRVLGGARYRVEAWVKGDNVKGQAGWYLHLGNDAKPMLAAPMLSAGDGTFDWKKVQLEFEVPERANRLQIGTVLHGTGTAWFDHVTLRLLEPGALAWKVLPVERMKLDSVGGENPGSWPPRSIRRAIVRVFNFSERQEPAALVAVDFASLAGRMKGHLEPVAIRILQNGNEIPHAVLGKSLLFRADRPPRSVSTFEIHVDWSSFLSRRTRSSGKLSSRALAKANLVRNGSFERGQGMPDDWEPTDSPRGRGGVTLALVRPGKRGAGERCLRLHVPRHAQKAWRGWRQRVPVRPGHAYLLAAWIRCKDVDEGDVRVHVHRLAADGKLAKENAMASTGQSVQGTTDWTLLSERFTMPEDTAFLEIHLTMGVHGTVWHDGVFLAEVVPASLCQFESRPMSGDQLVAWPVPSVVKVFPFDPPPATTPPAEIACASNEWETLQLAIRSGRDIQRLRVVAEPAVGPGGRLNDVHVNVVGLVPIDHATNYYRSDKPPWQRMVPMQARRCDGWPGRWPDPLLPTDTLTLQPNTTRSVWITYRVPADTRAGDYRGTVQLLDGNQIVARVPYRLHVWNFTLPKQSKLGAIYDVRFGPGGRHLWGDDIEKWSPDIVRFMAERRLCPDTIRPQPDIRFENGKVITDFREYDKAATRYFDQLKLPFAYTPWTFYLFGWGHPPKTFLGQRPYEGEPPYEKADRAKLRLEYKKVYQACLKAYWDHLKEKGWDKKIILYISDEPYDRHEHIRTQMKALCDMIHEVDPAIPIYSSTWKHVPDWDGYLNVWGIGHDGRVPVEKMNQLRAEGARLWFTTDGQMCTDTPYCAVERLLPHYCFKYGVQAYEFWGVAWQTYDPYQFGWHAYIGQSGEPGEHFWVRYPNGDGYLLYPGKPIGASGIVSSIRLEQAREGVEDYEYLSLLRDRIDTATKQGRDTARATKAMAAAAKLVTIPNDGGRYSTKILPDPNLLYRVRAELANAIESLGK